MFYERELDIRNDKELNEVKNLLKLLGLKLPEGIDYIIGIYHNKELIGTGSLVGNILQGIGVAPNFKEQGLAARIVSNLIKKAVEMEKEQLYVYTKPEEVKSFTGLGFQIVSKAEPYVVLLEWGWDGIEAFKNRLACYPEGKPENSSCIVVNCNPFTLGHRYLIEKASKESPWLYVIVVEEDKSLFPFEVRIKLIEEGTKDFKNITIIPGGKYVISSLTFPAYFTREEEVPKAQALLDLELFTDHITPVLKVKRRYVGEEPFCPVTSLYNECMEKILPRKGIELIVVKRLEKNDEAISASRVRELIRNDKIKEAKNLLPESTYKFLISPEAEEITKRIKNSSSRH
ncbi:MAG: hypothetical protein JM58_01180 [Peptococcaceae bacterium BICA1-8]|nr:MAG: hypothetical protein JM58_01180 [Peptococcaceae bacterium BICA1-8]